MDLTGQRMRVNLSDHALSIIRSDMQAFGVEESLGGFISRIIMCFAQNSDASIFRAANRYREKLINDVQTTRYAKKYPRDTGLEYFEIKKDKLLSPAELEVIESLVSAYKECLTAKFGSVDKGTSKNARLRNSAYELLCSMDDELREVAIYGTHRSAYVKALMEDYSSRSLLEREGIVFSEHIELLKSLCETDNRQRPLVTVKTGSSVFDVKPFEVTADPSWSHHYLVGMGRRANCDDAYRPMSFRISRIIDIKVRKKSYASGKITKSELGVLKEALDKRGVQYLVGEEIECTVLLTKQGLKTFETILHGRPEPVRRVADSNGNTILTFDCTARQISNYFLQFGSDAIILKPRELRDDFIAKYKMAVDAYSSAYSKIDG